jgi:hypothetical protein
MPVIRLIIILIIALGFHSLSFAAELPIIPSMNVNFFGMNTPAGSGFSSTARTGTPDTTICKVVNLLENSTGVDTDDSDGIVSGDIRYCVETDTGWGTGPRVVIFEVSGEIVLTQAGGGNMGFQSFTTVAGQTAPSPGIILSGWGTRVSGSDVLIQHMRFRTGEQSLYDLGCDGPNNSDPACIKSAISDPMVVSSSSERIVIDHCSFSWGADMNFMNDGGNTVSFTYNISSDALGNPWHIKGSHSKGWLMKEDSNGANDQNFVLAYNLLYNNVDRNPRVSGGKGHIINNVAFDIGPTGGMGISDHESNNGPNQVTVVGNYIKSGGDTNACLGSTAGDVWSNTDAVNTRVYFADGNNNRPANYYSDAVQTDPWNSEDTTCFVDNPCFNCIAGINCPTEAPECDVGATYQAAYNDALLPTWPSGFVAMSAENAYVHVLANAGARPADRDQEDTDVIAAVINGTASDTIQTVDFQNAWCAERTQDPDCCPNSCPDVSRESLAENTRSLTIPSNPHTVQASGYTALEEWLHGYSDAVEDLAGSPIDGVTIN